MRRRRRRARIGATWGTPERGMRPVPGRVTPHGAYAFDRGDKMHWGVDLAGEEGELVFAPTDGVVTEVATTTRKPWTGYAPIVLIGSDDGWSHLLAHVTPLVAAGDRVRQGDAVARIRGERHVHWEVRRDGHSSDGPNNTIDPLVWLEGVEPIRAHNRVVRSPDVASTGGLLWVAIGLLVWLKRRR